MTYKFNENFWKFQPGKTGGETRFLLGVKGEALTCSPKSCFSGRKNRVFSPP